VIALLSVESSCYFVCFFLGNYVIAEDVILLAFFTLSFSPPPLLVVTEDIERGGGEGAKITDLSKIY
jgi:hypothetical protein